MNANRKLVHLLSTNDPTQLTLVKHALDHEGIQYHVKSETLMRVDNVLATGIDGAWVMVKPEDHETARGLLIELRLMKMAKGENDFAFIKKFDQLTGGIPLLGRIPAQFRLLFLVFIAVAILFGWLIINAV